MKIPTDASLTTQEALRDADQRLASLERAVRDMVAPEQLDAAVAKIRKELRDATGKPGFETWEDVFGGETMKRSHVVYGEDPTEELREDGRFVFPRLVEAGLDDLKPGRLYSLDGSLLIAGHLACSNISGVPADVLNPGCRIWYSTTQGVTGQTFAILGFDTKRFDNSGMFDLAVSNSRITFKVPGKYMVGGSAAESTGAVGTILAIKKNGATYLAINGNTAAGLSYVAASTCASFIAGDYVELAYYVNGAGSRTVLSSDDYTPNFWAYRVGL
jgi:hypothetical protein